MAVHAAISRPAITRRALGSPHSHCLSGTATGDTEFRMLVEDGFQHSRQTARISLEGVGLLFHRPTRPTIRHLHPVDVHIESTFDYFLETPSGLTACAIGKLQFQCLINFAHVVSRKSQSNIQIILGELVSIPKHLTSLIHA